MAKENGKSKVRIFYAEIEGGDDAIESLANTFSRALQPKPRMVKVLPPANGTTPKSKNGNGEAGLFDNDPELVEIPADEAADNSDEPSDRPTKKRGPRKAASYSFVRDLDLRPDGKQSLRDFFAQKKPRNQQEQVTVVLYYLEKILGLTNIDANHIFTGLKDVGKNLPSDILQIARNIANRKGWIDSSDSNNLHVATHGLNLVEHDLPSDQPAPEE